MTAATRYAYLNARVSARSAQLLPPGRIAAAARRPGPPDPDLLRAAGFTDLDTPGAPSLEQRTITLLLADFRVLVRGLAEPDRELLVYWAYRFELSNLKTILRGTLTHQPTQVIRAQLVDMGPFRQLPIEALLRAETVEELLRTLEQTALGDIARQGRAVYEERHDLFALDAAVDRRYYTGLGERATDHHPRVRLLVGAIIDRVNLLWLLRYRFAYGLSAAETYYLLVPQGLHLPSPLLLRLCALDDFAAVLAALPPPIAQVVAGASDTTDVAVRLETHEAQLAGTVLRRTQFNLARAFAYLMLRERDLRRVRAIIKGKELQVAASVIARAIAPSEA